MSTDFPTIEQMKQKAKEFPQTVKYYRIGDRHILRIFYEYAGKAELAIAEIITLDPQGNYSDQYIVYRDKALRSFIWESIAGFTRYLGLRFRADVQPVDPDDAMHQAFKYDIRDPNYDCYPKLEYEYMTLVYQRPGIFNLYDLEPEQLLMTLEELNIRQDNYYYPESEDTDDHDKEDSQS